VEGDVSKLAAVALYMRHGNDVTAEQAIAIRNAMSTTTGAEGGFTVPTEVAKMVIDALKAYGGMRDVATILPSDSGNAWNYPASDGTTEEGEIVGENAPATSLDITFSQVPLNPFKYSSKKIALPIELIQDSAIDVIAFVVNRLATRLGRITNKHYTIGTGTGQPWGIVNRATAGKVGTTGQTLTVIYDDLADVFYSVNRAYRRGAAWSLADTSLRNVRKIKDTAGRPIFTPSYEAGITQDAPDLLMGKPIIINDDVPAMAANAKSILFGDHKQYTIRDVAGSTAIRRFDDSAFALNGQVGFCGWQRTGGNLLDTSAVKYYQNSAT
jgi:HK97 family phage major capsid protein